MPRENSVSSKGVLLIFLLLFVTFWKHCDSQVNREEANKPEDGRRGDGGAFFAMRSCQQLLRADGGEFFSPDYLCSNPPLWCNWTIQVDPSKRIHLHLEDLTPNDGCLLKEDQLHVDEPAGGFRTHKVLQKCWREAKYTSSSNTLYVVLLIGGWPSPPYRGFYGRYQAFGPLVVYNPREEDTETHGKSEPSAGLLDFNEIEDQVDSDLPDPAPVYDDYDQPSAPSAAGREQQDSGGGTSAQVAVKRRALAARQGLSTVPVQRGENQPAEPETNSHVHPANAAASPVPTSVQGAARSDRRATPTPSTAATSPRQQHGGQNQEPRPTTSSPSTTSINVEEEEASVGPEEESPSVALWSEEGGNRTAVEESSDLSSEAPEPERTEQTHPHTHMVEPLSDYRWNLDVRNHSDLPHRPGDHLFEVALEVSIGPDFEETWDDLASSLLPPLKALIGEQLKALHTPLAMAPKRIKRLSTGVLYILWLQVGQEHGGPRVHQALHSGLQGLVGDVAGNRRKAVLVSVSIADVNECGTQLVLCDLNADCLNQFGSYSCRCKPGFQDKSRQGPGGTVCLDQSAGCGADSSAETKVVYVLFFLLSFLILMLLVAAGLLYHRRHRGQFLVRCDGGSLPEPVDHRLHHHHDDCDLPPPPPPPARGFRENWPQGKQRYPVADLPLLSFSSLLPPDFKERKVGRSDQKK